MSENIVETDILVIGGGTAGCFAAIKAREQGLDVTIVDKGYAGKSGASIVAGGAWMVFNPEFGHLDFDAAMNEINKNGEYINNREWSEIILKESWATYQDLVSWGVEFGAEESEMKDYAKEQLFRTEAAAERPAHLMPFGLVPLRHRKTTPFLRKQAEKVGVKILDRIMIADLLKQDGKVVGAIGFPAESYDLYIFKAKSIVMSGGNNNFRSPGYHTSCLSGDADAMAYRAGAEITGKEFPDLHFNLANYPAWKSTAELYGCHWYFADAEGKHIPAMAMDLAMVSVIHAGKGPIVWDFDAATPEDVKAMQAYILKRGNPVEAERIGLDPSRGGKYAVIGGSAAGNSDSQTAGIWPINTKCASSVPGLYAAGDCCCTWCWGSIVRGAPWGLTPAAVTGKRAGTGAAEYALQTKEPVIKKTEITRLRELMYAPAERKGGFSPRWLTQLLRNTMMPYFILHIKHGDRLQAALTMIDFFRNHLVPKLMARDAHELRLAQETRNMVLNAEMILKASLFRTESRGRHYREDYPQKDDPSWLAWTKIKEDKGEMKLFKEPIPEEWWPDMSKPYNERYYPKWFPEGFSK
jgi:succinate dehydrogenase/fumarate reductase flavoprotein subunit